MNAFARTDSDRPVAVILGALGGVGSRLAHELRRQGYRLALLGRDRSPVVEGPRGIDELKLMVEGSDFEQVAGAFGQVVREFGRIDAVANCAGSLLIKPAHRTTAEEWSGVVASNLTTAFATVRAAAEHIPGDGSVVLVASAAGCIGLANHEAIAAVKAGVIGLARSAAATYASRGLRVNAVAPGLVRTPMTASITENPHLLRASEAMHPLGRIGEVGDIVAAMSWLMGPQASFITGQSLSVDGGLSAIGAKRSTGSRRSSAAAAHS